MTTLPCPLPQVEEALRPYIHARQETLRIRKTLAQHLQSQIHRTERQQGAEPTSPITPLTLACAPPSLLPELDQSCSASAPPPPPAELTGLRKQYWEAVQAHALAKRRRDALHGELNELQREAHAARAAAHTGPATDVVPYSSASAAPMVANSSGNHANNARHDVQSYVSLLHRRRRHARLQILLDALDRAADAQPDDDPLRRDDLRQWVKDRLGDAPIPPPEIAGGGNTVVGDASASAAAAADQTKEHVLRLKKELLLAKQNLDAETQRRAAVAHESAATSALGRGVEAQVRALRAARDELIAWIEGELAKMPEGDESILSGAGTPQRPDRWDDKEATGAAGTYDDAESLQEQVDALYERYVAVRTSLVVAVNAAATSVKELNTPSTLPGSNQQSGGGDGEAVGQKQQQQLRLPPSAALPFIPALLRSANNERILAQQTATHLRHQIAAAQEDARNTAQRLASESHLVGPDAESGGAWVRAAKEATRETDEAILERVRAGESNVEGAKDIFAELDRRKEGFRALRGEV